MNDNSNNENENKTWVVDDVPVHQPVLLTTSSTSTSTSTVSISLQVAATVSTTTDEEAIITTASECDDTIITDRTILLLPSF